MEPRTLILKTETRFEKEAERIKHFFSRANEFLFWRKHFANHGFEFSPERFGRDYWQTIPFFEKSDFLRYGLDLRLKDAAIETSGNIYNFILRMTSGTSGITEPLALLRPVTAGGRNFKKEEFRTLLVENAYVIGLLGTLYCIDANRIEGINRHQLLLLNPHPAAKKIDKTLDDFSPDNISAFPAALTHLSSLMLENKITAPTSIQNIFLRGDFLQNSQRALIENVFKKISIELGYGLGEFGRIGNLCTFLAKKYGLSAFHPVQYRRLIELADIDENGYGEIVATSFGNPATCLIRYRTGDVGRVLQEECECGKKFTLILTGRKNFDYVKCAGAMLVRQELERVLTSLKDYIEEWRAETREVLNGVRIVGEITLKIKVTSGYAVLANPKEFIRAEVEKNLFLTPTHTLANLISSGAFLPLKIEQADSFPETKKPLLLRRVD